VHRRPLGRGRILAVLGAIVVAVGSILPWWRLGGADTIPSIGGNAFQDAGIVVFIVALAILAVVTLPYATDAPVAVDRWPTFALLAVTGLIAYGLRIISLVTSGALRDGFLPDRSPGLWLAGAGLIVLARAAYDIAREPNRR
jgi:hypothetical protein